MAFTEVAPDIFAWSDTCNASVIRDGDRGLLRSRDGAGWLAFTGDPMLDGALLHTWYDSEWDHGFCKGLRTLATAAGCLEGYAPLTKLPAHGSPIRDAAPAAPRSGRTSGSPSRETPSSAHRPTPASTATRPSWPATPARCSRATARRAATCTGSRSTSCSAATPGPSPITLSPSPDAAAGVAIVAIDATQDGLRRGQLFDAIVNVAAHPGGE